IDFVWLTRMLVLLLCIVDISLIFFFFQAEDGIRDRNVTGVQTCALPISFPDVTRDELLAAAVSTQSSDDWDIRSKGGTMTMRPFAAIKDEDYRLYQKVST